MPTTHWIRSVAMAVALGIGTIAAGQAAPVQVRDGNGGSVFNGGPGSVNLTIKVNGANQSVAAGAFALEYRMGAAGAWTSFLTYCLEPDEWLGISGSTPMNGTLWTSIATTGEYAGPASAIASLYGTWFADSLTSAARSAAFQVALWELAFDSGASLAAGAFQLVGADSVRAQANAYLNPANWLAGGSVGVILRDGKQDLLVNVPEPATLALFGAGLAGLALLVRTRVLARRHR